MTEETNPVARDRSLVVSTAILLSRVSGLVRERVLGYFFGASLYADAWRAAMRLPNLLQNLLGEGVISSSFIPVLQGFRARGEHADARAFAGAIFGLLFVLVGVTVLVGMFFAGPLVQILFPGFDAEQQARTTGLVRILFPMTGVLVLSAWTLGILNVHRRFFLPYVASVLWNLAIIGALILGGWVRGLEADALLQLAGIGALVGGVLQFGVQVPRALRALGGFRPRVTLAAPGVRAAVGRFVPSLAGRGAVNLGSYLEYFLASFLATGAIAALGYAQTLYLLPIALFGMSVAITQLPELSQAEALQVKRAEVVARLNQALFRVSFFVVPSVAVYLVFSPTVVSAVYETGAFGAAEAELTAWVLGVYAVGIWPSAQSRLLSSAFFSVKDTKTPAWVALLRVVTGMTLGALLMLRLDELTLAGGLAMGAIGLAAGSAVGAWLEFIVLQRRLKAVLAEPFSWAGRPLLLLVASALAAIFAGVAVESGVRAGWIPTMHPILHAVFVLGPVGGIYLGLTAWLGLSSRRGYRFEVAQPFATRSDHD